jgi:glycerophosphoryl diester phosphodiesterase
MNAPLWLTAQPIAHRGLHDAASRVYENTLSAADAAIAAGLAIECDVQDTADGDAVVFHDHTLDRLTGAKGPVRGRRASELATLAVGGSADRIPTLSTFLERIAGRVPLVIEIKSRFDGDLRLARRTVETLAGYSGPVALKSFDPAIGSELRVIALHLPRGIVAQSRYQGGEWEALSPDARHALGNLLHLAETRPDFLSWRAADLPSAAPFLCRHLGKMPVMTWTVRSAAEARRVAPHADQIVFEGFHPERSGRIAR